MSCSRVGGCGVSQSVLVGHQFRSHTSSAATELFVSSGHQGTSPVQVTQHRGAQGTSVQQGSTGHVTSSGHQLRSLSVCRPNQAAHGVSASRWLWRVPTGSGRSPVQVAHFRCSDRVCQQFKWQGYIGCSGCIVQAQVLYGVVSVRGAQGTSPVQVFSSGRKGQNESMSADHGGSVD